jgi:predicted permease
MGRDPLWQRYRRFWESNPRADLDDELAFHLAMRAEEYRREGHQSDEAERLALRRFGDVEGIRRECHDLGTRRVARKQRAFRWDTMRNDIRYALRMLRMNRGFSLAVILTMALGIGATTAVFSVAYGVLLRPLAYRDADALVRLWSKNAPRNLEFFSVSPADYADWKAQNRVFSAMGAFERQRDAMLIRGGEPEAIEVAAVTPEIFALLGTSPAIGRAIGDDDARPGAPLVVVLGHESWVTRFGRDSAIIGRDISLDNRTHRVIGVMPPRFMIPGTPAMVWTGLSLTGASTDHANRYLRVLARLAPGMSLERARTELDVIASRLTTQYPGTNTGWTVNAMAVPEMIIGTQFRRAVLLLLGVVGFVLLIACANAANLQLARAAVRRREIAVRSALGASRGRIIAQLLAESTLLGLIAGVVGVGLAYGALAVLRSVGTTTVPRLEDVHLDGPVLAFAAAVALGSGILFGLVPAIRASRSDLAETLKEAVRGGSGGMVGEGVRSALVIAEVMLSLMLLVGAGLLMRSFVRLQRVDTGFDPKGLVVVPFRLPETSYAEPAQIAGFYAALADGVRAIPGVTAMAEVSSAPFAGPNSGLVFVRIDRPVADRQQAPDADYRVVTPGYFAAMHIPVLRGRDFTVQDLPGTGDLAVITETMARRYWPDEDPLGKSIRIGDVDKGPEFTIIGVASDARYQTLESPDTRPMVYFAAAQRPQRSMSLVVRTTDAASLATGVRRIVASLDKTMAPPAVSDVNDLVRTAFSTRRFALVLFGIFAGVATLLAGVGIYGVMAFLVRQRTHELGIRIALGAPQGKLMASVVGRALRMTVAGVVLGLLGAWMLTKSLDALLFQVSARDTATFVGVAVLIIGIGVLASVIPARRAMNADPMDALRG